ncbi:hypothetical protein ACJX0J_022240, partial [Zea mays]
TDFFLTMNTNLTKNIWFSTNLPSQQHNIWLKRENHIYLHYRQIIWNLSQQFFHGKQLTRVFSSIQQNQTNITKYKCLYRTSHIINLGH